MVLHQEQINEILELYRYGWLQKEIAEKMVAKRNCRKIPNR